MPLPTSNIDVQFTWRLLAMVATELIEQRHWAAWADQVIATDPQAPKWVSDLKAAATTAAGIDAIYTNVGAPPSAVLGAYPRDWIACQWLRYRSHAIPWPRMLGIAGTYADRYDAGVASEEFDRRLNEYMANPSTQMVALQEDWVAAKFEDAIERIEPLYQGMVKLAGAAGGNNDE